MVISKSSPVVFSALGFLHKNLSIVVGLLLRIVLDYFLSIYLWYTTCFNHTKRKRFLFQFNLQLLVWVPFPTKWYQSVRLCVLFITYVVEMEKLSACMIKLKS